jgi:phenylacetate-CoA ligase
MYRQWNVGGWEPGEKVVLIAGSSLYPSIHSAEKWLYVKLNNWLLLSAFGMSDSIMFKWADRVRRCKARFMHGYASSIYLFAKFLIDHNINDIKLRSVCTSAEPLLPHYRDTISAAFSCEVFDLYGAVDGGAFAFECERHSGFHCVENSYIEIVKEDGRSAEDGETGEIVSTDLYDYAMPFIRYRTGDLATAQVSDCSCGRKLPLLKNIMGRRHDYLVTKDGQRVHGEFFAHVIRGYDWISQYYVVQDSPSCLRIYLKTDRQAAQHEVESIRTVIQKKFIDAHLTIELTDTIPQYSSGKFRYVINKSLGQYTHYA